MILITICVLTLDHFSSLKTLVTLNLAPRPLETLEPRNLGPLVYLQLFLNHQQILPAGLFKFLIFQKQRRV